MRKKKISLMQFNNPSHQPFLFSLIVHNIMKIKDEEIYHTDWLIIKMRIRIPLYSRSFDFVPEYLYTFYICAWKCVCTQRLSTIFIWRRIKKFIQYEYMRSVIRRSNANDQLSNILTEFFSILFKLYVSFGCFS